MLGREIAAAARTTTGGSRITWIVDLAGDPPPDPVVVRVEGQGSFTGTEVSLVREVAAFRALASTRVPVPGVHAVHPDGSAAILERLAGTDDLDRFQPDDRAAALNDFAAVLAEMHRVDPDTLDLPGFGRPSTPEEHARIDLAMWQRLASSVVDLDPLIAYTGGWLQAHAPTTVARTVFVQGDTGPGNFMADAGRVTGLVDMEFAHIGDPMDDLAWVMMRMRSDAAYETFVDAYTRHGGAPIGPASVAFYRLAVDYRCAVTTSLAVARGGGARGWAPYQLQTQRYLDGIAERLTAATGLQVPPVDVPEVGPTARTAMFDQLLATLRTAARSIADPEISAATRNDQILVHLLRAHDRLGAAIEAGDAADLAGTGGAGATAIDAGAAAAAGEADDDRVLGVLLRRRRRQRLLWSTLLERSAPPVRSLQS
ncbi:MAG: phosphotransferase family protein [Acidimicrobiia bacterium]